MGPGCGKPQAALRVEVRDCAELWPQENNRALPDAGSQDGRIGRILSQPTRNATPILHYLGTTSYCSSITFWKLEEVACQSSTSTRKGRSDSSNASLRRRRV